jgi:predicted alpha-1,2-mannosidase
LNHRDKLLEGRIRVIDDKTIEVLRRSEAWATNQYVFARIEFNKPLKLSMISADSTNTKNEFFGTNVALNFSKQVKKGEKIFVKVALSPTSYEGAKLNSSEIKHWDFEKVHQAAIALWNKELSKIEVTSNDKDKLVIFYTALYHTMMQPNIAQDLDGKYRGRDNQIHVAEGFDYYTVFSLWDTFRAAHPLYTLIDKKRTADYINTFIKQFEQGGRLPVWELASNETDCMIGYHSVSVIADAMVKGIKGFDYEKAFEASKHSAMLDHLGLDAYKKQGFISIDDEHESVSKTLEYAYDDWCIAQMAQLLGKQEDYQYFMERSQYWKNLFNWDNKFIQPKKNGGWDKPFDPKEVNNNFTEANAWQYTFFVPQDIHGMIEAYGGNEKFEAKLDEMFNSVSETSGRHQVDITGLIGQYAHGNEPSHHVAYLYNYIGKPEKTKEKVHYILDNFYTNTPDGLIGNEDCGQMSAWYVLSSMGIYQVTPGEDYWQTITPPYFEKVKVMKEDVRKVETYLPNGRTGFLNQEGRETIKKEIFPSIISVPVIEAESKAFKDNLKIEIKANNNNLGLSENIYFRVLDENNTHDKTSFVNYKEPFEIYKSSKVEAYVEGIAGGKPPKSKTVSAQFFKKPNNYTINIKSVYNPQYHAGGPDGLLDGIYGSENWRKGDWQGYQTQDFEAVIDLQTKKNIQEISSNFLQDTRAWIVMPTEVSFYVSDDNISFQKVATIANTIPANDYEVQTQKLTEKLNTSGRYVKVIAKNFGKLPEWHQGFPFDGEAFIFIDEIEVK